MRMVAETPGLTSRYSVGSIAGRAGGGRSPKVQSAGPPASRQNPCEAGREAWWCAVGGRPVPLHQLQPASWLQSSQPAASAQNRAWAGWESWRSSFAPNGVPASGQ